MKKSRNILEIYTFIISITYGFIVKYGIVGFGIDYVAAYHKSNVIASNIYNSIGWYLSTLNILDIHLGIFLVPFLISLSAGNILKFFFIKQDLNSIIIFLIVLILSLFSWPLLISSNNAMRQGLMMAFVFFSLLSFVDKKYYLAFFFILLASFTHRSGIAFLFVILNVLFFKIIIEKKFFDNHLNYLIYGLILFSVFFAINLNTGVYYGRYVSNKTIGLDFRYLNLVINLLFIFYFTFNFKLLKDFILLYLYFFSFSALAILCAGLNWEYERYNMTMIPLYIFAFSLIFNFKSKYIYFLSTITILFILTLITGMYDFGVGVFTWEP